MNLAELARELYRYTLTYCGTRHSGGYLRDGDLLSFFETVIPILEEHEQRQELIRAFNAANKTGQIIAVPDERAERRTLAIAQMAAVLIAIRKAEVIAYGLASVTRTAIGEAESILVEVEKRG